MATFTAACYDDTGAMTMNETARASMMATISTLQAPQSPSPPSSPPPLSCGPGTEENAESGQCEIVCPNAQSESGSGWVNSEQSESGLGSESSSGPETGSGSVGTRRRTREDSEAARSIFESFLLQHPNEADDVVWQMQKALSEGNQDFRQPTSA